MSQAMFGINEVYIPIRYPNASRDENRVKALFSRGKVSIVDPSYSKFNPEGGVPSKVESMQTALELFALLTIN